MDDLLKQMPNGGAVAAIVVVSIIFLKALVQVVARFTNEMSSARKDYLDHLKSISPPSKPRDRQ